MMSKLKPFKHQNTTIKFLAGKPEAMIASSPGTGKTMCIIHDIDARLAKNPESKTLIIAPKSLLYSAWRDDFIKFAPHIITSVATAPASKRQAAFEEHANVYITNTDAVTWIDKQLKANRAFLNDFETIVVDESGFFMNDSARTKALLRVRLNFKYARALNGTLTGGPMSNLYYQYYFLQGPKIVGNSFGKFRNMTMIGVAKPNMPQYLNWENKPGIEPVLAKLFKPVTIRYDLTDVVDMPSRLSYTFKYLPNKKVLAAYKQMKQAARLALVDAEMTHQRISAVNAAATVQKLAQIASGSVYNEDGESVLVDTQRFDLVVDLLLQYKQNKPLVFFNYRSQREYMMKYAEKAGLRCAFIDGSVSTQDRGQIVEEFQAGFYDCLFLNPLAASHGLTLTASSCSIWSVPIYRGDVFIQAQHRNFRIGQKDKVLTILIEARKTLERGIYNKLTNKVNSINLLNDALI